jgi:hypothetical protein
VRAFVALAERFCALVEGGPLTAPELLEGAGRLLPELYSAVHALPEVEPATEGLNTGRITHDEWSAIFQGMQRVLGPHDLYRDVYDRRRERSGRPARGRGQAGDRQSGGRSGRYLARLARRAPSLGPWG